jgi:hypothetical protein
MAGTNNVNTARPLTFQKQQRSRRKNAVVTEPIELPLQAWRKAAKATLSTKRAIHTVFHHLQPIGTVHSLIS